MSRIPISLHFSFSLLLRFRVLFVLCVFFVCYSVNAQSVIQNDQNSAPSIGSVLNKNGTVNSNISGSFSAQGFEMSLAVDGTPRFIPQNRKSESEKSRETISESIIASDSASFEQNAPTAACGDGWDDRFSPLGTDGSVSAVVADGNGNVYVGGSFTVVDNVAANHVAKWDGTVWSALGSGTDGKILALAVSGTDLYVGGDFYTAGDAPAVRVAKWDGSGWSALGNGVESTVYALAVMGTDLYVGGFFSRVNGSFSMPGSTAANHIAKWNGTGWSALGIGVSGNVRALAVSGTTLYAGGNFTQAGGITVNNVAKWNGTGWSALGSGMVDGSVYSLAVLGSDLYAGGLFAGTIKNIAKWNGSFWSPLVSGTNSAYNGVNGTVYALTVSGTDLYVGGDFTSRAASVGSITVNRVAKWSNSTWSTVGTGTNGTVFALASPGSILYSGGGFSTASGAPAGNITRWNNSVSLPFGTGNGVNSTINAVVADGNGNIYIGGSFTSVGNVLANRVAKWNGSSWSALGSGTGDTIYALAISGTDLYAGGFFTSAGGVAANYIAKWNGTGWSSVGSGMNSNVIALAAAGTDIYAGGNFSTAGGVAANYIAKWNGTGWSSVSSGMNNTVYALAASGTDIYAAGGFSTAGGVPVNYVAKWNGTNWSPVGSGLNISVNALAISGTDIYIGGGFREASSPNHVAKLNGSGWSALGSGLNGDVNALAIFGGDLYAGGDFTTAGGAPANYLAKWNGSVWSPVGGGMNGEVNALLKSGTDLYAGGIFSTAGCRVSNRFARLSNQAFAGGGANNDWFTAGNWNTGAAPAAASDATVNADVSVSTADATIRDLRIETGRSLTIVANRTLTINGNLSLAGTIDGDGTVIVTTCNPASISREITAGYIRATLVRCVNNSGTFNFPVGTANGYAPVQMSNINGAGNVAVKAVEGEYSNPANNLPVNRLARWWQIDNPGSGITRANLTFNYLQSDVNGIEANYQAYNVTSGAAIRMLSTMDTANNTATLLNVSQFANWTLAQIAPTAASVSVGGRITTATGNGIANIRLSLTDTLGNVRTTVSASSGYYRFDNVEVGSTYIILATGKRYTFSQPSQILNINDETDQVNFIANLEKRLRVF